MSKLTEIEVAAKEAIAAIEDMTGPDCSIEEYLVELRRVRDFLDVAIEASEADLRRGK